jgi:hypothetical protein
MVFTASSDQTNVRTCKLASDFSFMVFSACLCMLFDFPIEK